MLLVDAVYINKSGGKVLLDYLVDVLEDSSMDVFYMFDKRIKDDYSSISCNKKTYLNPSLFSRLNFYWNNRNRFQKVLCFGNAPPLIKLVNSQVYTYFHNILILRRPKGYRIRNKILVVLRKILLLIIKSHSDWWIVQSAIIADELNCKLRVKPEKILIIPFYNVTNICVKPNRQRNTYLYASSGSAHKNVDRLLTAWEELFDEGYLPVLHLTLSDEWENLIERIRLLNQKGLIIINHGLLAHDDLMNMYSQIEFLVYPSLVESFGLPLIEAVKSGCKVIASDLPFTHAVIQPSLTFDPHNVQSIKETITDSIQKEVELPKVKINDEVQALLSLVSL
jgi:glycosyltransferase involved in cell wall biosynthesis